MITKPVFDKILTSLERPAYQEREEELIPAVLHARAVAMVRRGYEMTAPALEALRLYLAGYGLFVYGPVGTGKTFFFRAIRTPWDEMVKVISMHEIIGREDREIRELMEDCQQDEVLLDDIGAEPIFNNYGVKFDILGYLIDRRMQSRMRTHFTTNLSKADILKRYGGRVIDRIAEMCRSVEFPGKSRRKPTANSAAVKEVHNQIVAAKARIAQIAAQKAEQNKQENQQQPQNKEGDQK